MPHPSGLTWKRSTDEHSFPDFLSLWVSPNGSLVCVFQWTQSLCPLLAVSCLFSRCLVLSMFLVVSFFLNHEGCLDFYDPWIVAVHQNWLESYIYHFDGFKWLFPLSFFFVMHLCFIWELHVLLSCPKCLPGCDDMPYNLICLLIPFFQLDWVFI